MKELSWYSTHSDVTCCYCAAFLSNIQLRLHPLNDTEYIGGNTAIGEESHLYPVHFLSSPPDLDCCKLRVKWTLKGENWLFLPFCLMCTNFSLFLSPCHRSSPLFWGEESFYHFFRSHHYVPEYLLSVWRWRVDLLPNLEISSLHLPYW